MSIYNKYQEQQKIAIQAAVVEQHSAIADPQPQDVEEPILEEPEQAEQDIDLMEYANSFDGIINIRETPTSKGTVIGKFKNGTEGAVLLEDGTEWVHINYRGVVGYVYKKYVTNTPTKEVLLDIDGDWLKGVWRKSNENYAYLIFNNGTYAIQSASETLAYGTYMLEGNDIVFFTTHNIGVSVPSVQRFTVDVTYERVGNMYKYQFIEESETYQYRGRLAWTKSQYAALRKEILLNIQKNNLN